MKKNNKIVLFISVLSIILIFVLCNILVFIIAKSQRCEEDTYLLTSQSPDGKYTLKAYRTEPGATIDFSVKVYLVSENTKTLIYNVYHEYTADIIWIDNCTVKINGMQINLSETQRDSSLCP